MKVLFSGVTDIHTLERFEAPESPSNYVRRASLLQLVEPALDRRLTVLRAPAGFGKTTVLADVSHRMRQDGVVVGWLSLDENDEPGLLLGGIARALERGGLNPVGMYELDDPAPFTLAYGMALLAGVLERHAAPCLLVLDDVDRLPAESARLVDRLVQRAPDNLHVAMTFQSRPRIDFATHVLAGSGQFVGTEGFRFSAADSALFFGGELSRREWSEVEKRTAGWPVALRLCRNVRVRRATGASADVARLSAQYVEERLLRCVPSSVRADLLDLAVFDRIEATLVNEVLGARDACLRILKRPELDGLLLSVDADGDVHRLHPLVREYCVDRLSAEDPARMQSLHARIALVQTRRSVDEGAPPVVESGWRRYTHVTPLSPSQQGRHPRHRGEPSTSRDAGSR